MKQAFRLIRRGRHGVFYRQDTETGVQLSLGTKDKATAKRLLEAENKTRREPALNLEFAKIYAKAPDPKLASRIWQEAMDDLSSHGNLARLCRARRKLAAGT